MIEPKGPVTYEEAVKDLVAFHQGPEGEVKIFYLPDPDKSTVRLVEISQAFGDDTVLRPVAMGASKDFPFSSSVLLVSKSDWEKVRNGVKHLPAGWDKTSLKEMPTGG